MLVALRRAVHVALPVAVVLVAEALAAVRAQEAVLRVLPADLLPRQRAADCTLDTSSKDPDMTR